MEIKKPYTELTGIESNFIKLYGEVTQMQIDRYTALFNKFKKVFNANGAYIASSSGRVEVCGNHTDHNGGRVVSCAISLDTLAMFLPTDNNVIHIKSEGYDDIIVDLNGEEKEKIGTSPALVRGVSVALKNKGYKVGGFNACFTSNVLGGAGISSSASFEVLIAEIMNFLYNDGKISAETKSIVAQYSENVYFGKPCGLLDQTAIAFGGLKKLNFADKSKIQVSEIHNSLSDYTLVLINTGGSHAELTGEYASIPQEMLGLAKKMGKDRLIDIPEDEFYARLPEFYNKVSDRAITRSIHFYNENKRVDTIATSLENNDYESFLKAIYESGVSSLCKLQNCYVAGSSEQPIPKALSVAERFLRGGANRVHGGGFAGTTLNIVKNENLDFFINEMNAYYKREDIIPLKVRSVGTIVL
jgi:galactokinase